MAITDLIIQPILEIINKIIPDPAQKAAAQLALLKLQQDGELAQITGQTDINKVEAASTSVLVAGWRPLVGWICGLGLGVQFLIAPFATWIAQLADHPIAFPTLDLGTLMTLLFGMLGLGTLRTVEKAQGVAGNH